MEEMLVHIAKCSRAYFEQIVTSFFRDDDISFDRFHGWNGVLPWLIHWSHCQNSRNVVSFLVQYILKKWPQFWDLFGIIVHSVMCSSPSSWEILQLWNWEENGKNVGQSTFLHEIVVFLLSHQNCALHRSISTLRRLGQCC